MFLMPALLLGLLGVSIPIIIHLLHRQRTQPVLWGAMQFLRESTLQMKRRKKVDHWILMIVRILALAVLALLLARPLWVWGKYLPKGLVSAAPVDVAVVLDHSLSTGRTANGQTVFDQGVGVVDKVLEQLRPGDTISVILAEHRARPVNVQPIKKDDGRGVAALRQLLRLEKQGMTDCSIPEAISASRRLIDNGRNFNKLILVVSDQQRSNWHIKDDALWRAALGDRAKELAKSLSVSAVPIAPDLDAPNVSVGQVALQPTLLGINRPAQVTANVSNTGAKAMSGLSAKLVMNGKEIEAKQLPELAQGSATTVRFDLEKGFTAAGSGWVKVAVNANDSLKADNEAVAAANVWQRLPVLIIDGQLTKNGAIKSSRFLEAALKPDEPSLVQPKVISITDAAATKLDDYAVAILNDCPTLPGELQSKLEDYARAGHGVWFILGQRTQKTLIAQDLSRRGLFKAEVNELKSAGEQPPGIEVKDPNNPMVAMVAANERNALTGAATRKWWSIKPLDGDTQIVLAGSGGDPLILERPFGPNGGIVAVWCTSVDGSWNNWHLMPNFVPLVNETLYHLAAGQTRGHENRGIEAGQPIEWTGPAKPAAQSVQITLPDGSSVQRVPVMNNGRWMVTYPDTFLPGIYKLQFQPTEIQTAFYGVNIDRRELDNTALSKDDVDWLASGRFLDPAHPQIDAGDLAVVIRKENKGKELWGWLGGLLLASLLFETYMTYRLIGSQKRLDVASAGLLSPSRL